MLQHTIVSVCEYEDHKYNAFKIYILSFTFCLCIGPESLLRRPAMVTQEPDSDSYYHYLREDIVEKEDWRCFHTVNGEHHWSVWHMVPNECTTELVVILMCKDLIWSVLLKQAFESLRMSQLQRCSLLGKLSTFPKKFFLWVANSALEGGKLFYPSYSQTLTLVF